jgi:hypothetical protein
MNLEDALGLKDDILMRLLSRQDVPAHPNERLGRRRSLRGGHVSNTAHLSLGIEPRGRGDGDFDVVVYYRHQRLRALLADVRRFAGRHAEVRFVRVGRVRAASDAGFAAEDVHRPLRIGASISHHRGTAGTLTCFVRLNGHTEIHCLSNNHILANSSGAVGDGVVQPGRKDGGRLAKHHVGALSAMVPLVLGLGSGNLVDCAAASVADHAPPEADLARLPDPHGNWDAGDAPPTRMREPTTVPLAMGQRVWKYGRSSGWTPGVIKAFEVSIDVTLRVNGKSHVAGFAGQMTVEGLPERGAFAKAGDSGAAILLPDGSPVAMVFAVTDEGGGNGRGLVFANPFNEVLTQLDARLCL